RSFGPHLPDGSRPMARWTTSYPQGNFDPPQREAARTLMVAVSVFLPQMPSSSVCTATCMALICLMVTLRALTGWPPVGSVSRSYSQCQYSLMVRPAALDQPKRGAILDSTLYRAEPKPPTSLMSTARPRPWFEVPGIAAAAPLTRTYRLPFQLRTSP